MLCGATSISKHGEVVVSNKGECLIRGTQVMTGSFPLGLALLTPTVDHLAVL